MPSPERGKVYHRKLAGQLRDFSGLRYGKITPTDIDGFIDFGNQLFVFMEAKVTGMDLPYGQRLALERLVDASTTEDQRAIGIVCEHENRDGDIDFANCIVTELRWNRKWRKPGTLLTVRDAIDRTLEHCGLDYSNVKPVLTIYPKQN